MRMKHPEHGWHVPMPGERESMLKNGWVDDVPEPASAPPQPDEVEAAPPPGDSHSVKRGPGRPRKEQL